MILAGIPRFMRRIIATLLQSEKFENLRGEKKIEGDKNDFKIII